MSQAVIHDRTVYLAGQVGSSGESAGEQTVEALAEIDHLLALAGTDKSRLLTATVWLADMARFSEMNRAWEQWISPAPPAKPGWPPPGYLVEIIVSAAV